MTQPLEIIIPPRWLPAGRRIALQGLRSVPVGQRHAFRAYNKLTKVIRRHRATQTYFGATVECDLDDLIAMCIFHFGVWEPHISQLIEARLRPGDLFCDVGANIGYHSLLASRLVGEAGRVVAVEPSPTIFARLVRHMQLNRAGNVRPVQLAVGAAAGTMHLYRGAPANTSMASTTNDRGYGKECDVACRPLSDILSPEERGRLRLIKIDVEGGELPILRDLIDTIALYARDLEVLVEISAAREGDRSERPPDVDAIFSRFRAEGFKAYSVPNSYDLMIDYLNFRGSKSPEPIELPPREQQDVLFSRSYDPTQ